MLRRHKLLFGIVLFFQLLFLTNAFVCRAEVRKWIYKTPGESEATELYAEYMGVEELRVLLKAGDGKIHRVPLVYLTDDSDREAVEKLSRTTTASFREWTGARGTKFVARYSGITSNGILLITREGTVINYPWKRLSAEEKQFIIKQQQAANAVRSANAVAARKWKQLENGVLVALLRSPDKSEKSPRKVLQFAFSPDSKKLFSSIKYTPYLIWNLSTFKTQTIKYEHNIHCACFTPKGQYLLAGKSGTWHRINLAKGPVLELGPNLGNPWRAPLRNRKVLCMAFPSKGTKDTKVTTVAMGLERSNNSADVVLMDLTTEKIQESLVVSEQSDNVDEVIISFDGSALAANLDDGGFRAWKFEGKKRQTLSLKGRAIQLVDNGTFVVQKYGKRLRLYQIADGELKGEITLGWQEANSSPVAASPVGRLMVAAYGPDLYLFDWTSSEHFERISGKGDRITALQFSPDGKWMASGDAKGNVRLWNFDKLRRSSNLVDVTPSKPPATAPLKSTEMDKTPLGDETPSGMPPTGMPGIGSVCLRLPGEVNADVLAWSPDGKTLATSGYNKTICLWDATSGKKCGVLEDPQFDTSALLFSPDGTVLAAADSGDGVSLWDLSAKTVRKVNLDVGYGKRVLSFSPDGHLLAVACEEGLVKVLPIADQGKNIVLRGNGKRVTSVCFSPDGRSLAVGSDDKKVRVWDMASRQIRDTLEGHKDGVRQVAFSPSGKYLASLGDDSTVRLWDSATGKLTVCFKVSYGDNDDLSFSPDGSCLATSERYDLRLRSMDAILRQAAPVSEDPAERLRQQNLSAKTVVVEPAVSIHYGFVPSRRGEYEMVSFSPDGSVVATVHSGGAVWLWDVASLWTHQADAPRHVLRGHDKNVNSLAISPDSRTLASGSYDKTVRLWDMLSGNEQSKLEGHRSRESVCSVSFHSTGRILASGGGQEVILWKIPSCEKIMQMDPLKDDVDCLAFSPDGHSLAVGGEGKQFFIVDLEKKKNHLSLPPVRHDVNALAFSPDSKSIAFSREYEKEAQIRDARTGVLQRSINTGGQVNSLAFSNDGLWLALCGNGFPPQIRDVSTGNLVKSFEGFKGTGTCVSITPDGQTLAAGGYNDPKIHIWDVNTGKVKGLFGEDDRSTRCLAFSPDGKHLVAARADGAIYIWNARAYSNLHYGTGISENTGLLVGRMFANEGFLDPTLGTRLVLTKSPVGYALSIALPNSGWKDNQIVQAILKVAKEASEKILKGSIAVRLCDEDLNIRRIQAIGDPAVARPFACLNTTESNPRGNQVLIRAKTEEEQVVIPEQDAPSESTFAQRFMKALAASQAARENNPDPATTVTPPATPVITPEETNGLTKSRSERSTSKASKTKRRRKEESSSHGGMVYFILGLIVATGVILGGKKGIQLITRRGS